MPEIELLLDCRAIIGESPTWFAPKQALYWIDVKAPTLHRLSADGVRAQWRFDADIGAFALLADATGAHSSRFATESSASILSREKQNCALRLLLTQISFASTRGCL